MIPASEVREAAARLLVPEFQIVRDHMVSHILGALETLPSSSDVIFFGGTALCRTWCPNLRLSEDIDLIVADYPAATDAILGHLKIALRSEYPDFAWGPFQAYSDTRTTTATAGSSSVKVQFVKPRPAESIIPVIVADVLLAYSDLPPTAKLRVPTAEGFAAMKLMAWHQRQACRDLYDLAALAEIGALTAESVAITERVTGSRVGLSAIDHTIPQRVVGQWENQLGHQLNAPVSAEDCLERVVSALRLIQENEYPD